MLTFLFIGDEKTFKKVKQSAEGKSEQVKKITVSIPLKVLK
ncbi:hypothetical protein GPV39_19715, partial [Salmonella enterica subsp. enterica serovar Typhimurium]|nr:hypothetical protein [Salmonella enterica subsp. enterica serovar Typhimurium]